MTLQLWAKLLMKSTSCSARWTTVKSTFMGHIKPPRPDVAALNKLVCLSVWDLWLTSPGRVLTFTQRPAASSQGVNRGRIPPVYLRLLLKLHVSSVCVWEESWYFSSVSHIWCTAPAASLTVAMFTYNWLCIHFHPWCTWDESNYLHRYNFEKPQGWKFLSSL